MTPSAGRGCREGAQPLEDTREPVPGAIPAGRRATARPALWAPLLVLLFAVATLVLWHTRGWVAIGVPHFDPLRWPFSDAFVVLWGPEQCAAGRGEWVARVCFVPDLATEAHAQAYEPWLTFHRLGLGSGHLLPVSALMIAAFYVAMASTLKPASAGEFGLCALLLATPAVQLAVERANFDLLVAAMLCLAAWLLARGRDLPAVAACGILGLATALKLYTGLACGLAWIAARSPRPPVLVAAVVASALAVGILGPENIAVLGRGAPEGATRFSIGAHWLFRQRGEAAGWIAMLSAAAITIVVAARLARAPAPDFAAHPNRAAAFDLAFLTAIPLFFLKDSYDYRLVLWLPCLALPLAWLRGGAPRAWRVLAAATLGLYLVAAGAELPCSLLDRWAQGAGSDLAATTISLLVYAKQAAAWLLVGALSLIMGGGLAQRAAPLARGWPGPGSPA